MAEHVFGVVRRAIPQLVHDDSGLWHPAFDLFVYEGSACELFSINIPRHYAAILEGAMVDATARTFQKNGITYQSTCLSVLSGPLRDMIYNGAYLSTEVMKREQEVVALEGTITHVAPSVDAAYRHRLSVVGALVDQNPPMQLTDVVIDDGYQLQTFPTFLQGNTIPFLQKELCGQPALGNVEYTGQHRNIRDLYKREYPGTFKAVLQIKGGSLQGIYPSGELWTYNRMYE